MSESLSLYYISLTSTLLSIYTIDVSIKIYKYGDKVKEDFKFNPYTDIGTTTCPGHKEKPMASSKVKGKYERADCRNP